MAQLATVKERAVARPLKVLAELIKKDLVEADVAGKPYYAAIADKLNEALYGHFEGKLSELYGWAEKQFGKTQATIRTWMTYGSSGGYKSFKNIEQFTFTPKEQGGRGHTPRSTAIRRGWTAPVDAVAERARNEARRLALEDSLTRTQEREAERKLALRLIDIGFKVLARELHPDKIGGDRDAMARLNRVRNRLKECI